MLLFHTQATLPYATAHTRFSFSLFSLTPLRYEIPVTLRHSRRATYITIDYAMLQHYFAFDADAAVTLLLWLFAIASCFSPRYFTYTRQHVTRLPLSLLFFAAFSRHVAATLRFSPFFRCRIVGAMLTLLYAAA